jgi:hypothetical protein
MSFLRTPAQALLLVVGLSIFGPLGTAKAACYSADQQMAAPVVSDFLANPGALLQQAGNGQGGDAMIAMVRDLVMSNPATLPAVINLLKTANGDQQKAIGNALGQAANLCVGPDRLYADDIQAQLALATSEDAKQAYAVITGNYPTGGVAAGGAGGGASPGAGGGSINQISNGGGASAPFQAFTSNSVTTPASNFFTGGGVGSLSAVGSVSP